MDHLLTWRQRGRLWLRLGIRVALTAAAALLLVYVILPSMDLALPFLLALIVAWLLNPMVRAIQKRIPVSRKTISLVLIILLCGAVGGALFGLGWMAFDQIRSFIYNWDALQASILSAVDTVTAWAYRLGEWLPNEVVVMGQGLLDTLLKWLGSLDFGGWLADMAGQAPSFITGVTGSAIGVVVCLMASYFITGDYPRLRYRAADMLPASLLELISKVKEVFFVAFGGYLRSQVLLSLCVFVILMIGFFIIRQPYGLLLAAGLAVLDFIPIIGAGTVLVPWAAVCVILSDWQGALSRLILWGVIALFRRLAEPKVLGDQTGLSPILSLAGIYVGMRLGGVLGMILGPVLLLIFINITHLGIFNPTLNDLRLAAADIQWVLLSGREDHKLIKDSRRGPEEDGGT